MFKFWKTFFCFCWLPMYFGGDSESDSSTTTNYKISNTATSTDKRSVASDAAVSLSGDGNTVDRSTNIQTTDYGSVGSALSGLGQMTGQALNVTGSAVNGAVGALAGISADSQKSIASAFAAASASSANSMTNSAAVLGFASSAIDKTNAAFAEAKDSGASKIMTYAIAAVAAIGIAFALKRA